MFMWSHVPWISQIQFWLLGRGPLSKKVARNAFSLHPSIRKTWFVVYLKDILGTLLSKEVPLRKTFQISRKRVICYY